MHGNEVLYNVSIKCEGLIANIDCGGITRAAERWSWPFCLEPELELRSKIKRSQRSVIYLGQELELWLFAR